MNGTTRTPSYYSNYQNSVAPSSQVIDTANETPEVEDGSLAQSPPFMPSHLRNATDIKSKLGKNQPYMVAAIVLLFLILIVTSPGSSKGSNDGITNDGGFKGSKGVYPDEDGRTPFWGGSSSSASNGTESGGGTDYDEKVPNHEEHNDKPNKDIDYSAEDDDDSTDPNEDDDFGQIQMKLFNVHDANFTQDPDLQAPWPRLALLLYYPMSGRSYSQRLYMSLSGYTIGTNSLDTASPDKRSRREVPIHPDINFGPFWSDPVEHKVPTPMSKTYALIPTSCAGYCENCAPKEFVETYFSFEESCRTVVSSLSGDGGGGGGGAKIEKRTPYPPHMISRVVHLFREPLSNVVSRFHSFRRKLESTKEKNKYKDDTEGFHTWCKEMDSEFVIEEKDSKYFTQDIMEMLEGVPCRDEFFRWIQFHNLAAEVAEHRMMPSLAVYFEDYDIDRLGTVTRMSDFLNFKVVTKDWPKFHGGKLYRDYYKKDERDMIWNFLRGMASPRVYSLINRYLSYGVEGGHIQRDLD